MLVKQEISAGESITTVGPLEPKNSTVNILARSKERDLVEHLQEPAILKKYQLCDLQYLDLLSVNRYKDCVAILKKNPGRKGKDGVYTIYPDGKGKKKVYCDMTTDGGGWTAIQRRQDGSTDFYRTWSEYKQGFGDPSKNYWIGNDVIFELTKNKDQELRIELQRFNGAEAYAQYSTFHIGDKYVNTNSLCRGIQELQ
ncbi:fibrinogen-like protein A, partial [Saccostrea cucullata]|uniref:fibrinogen-like protein A n=1 Tax=Saccostrea cuccullata TaxID=36930 RepID=UPI002ED2E732